MNHMKTTASDFCYIKDLQDMYVASSLLSKLLILGLISCTAMPQGPAKYSLWSENQARYIR